ncbi:hypothetical protein BOTBODRAFT_189814 [Botryobasidium botryosum FD-172 SS1]|uniref:Aquaporin-like protein n=1 Tax=Botryobasidium botryosum (strain FD-172 SS1) TaxID=930990 RepID=A0A067M7A4_BOTB1|nr:hypothetical protein BOTBODRAFT_189814 [Botryobasidium botryosum FD-172 SS1]
MKDASTQPYCTSSPSYSLHLTHISPPQFVVASTVFGRMPGKRVPGYILAQVSGAFCGSLLAYGLLNPVINGFEGGWVNLTIPGSSNYFALEDPQSFLLHYGVLFLYECSSSSISFYGTIPKNTREITSQIFPYSSWSRASTSEKKTVEGHICNPAQSLGLRMALYAVGYGPEVWWWQGGQGWLCAPIVAPVLDGLLGAWCAQTNQCPRKYAKATLRPRQSALITASDAPWGRTAR